MMACGTRCCGMTKKKAVKKATKKKTAKKK